MWDIYRGKEPGEVLGKAIPCFIKNIDYNLITVDVFSDGVVSAWGSYDLDLFRGKLESQWVVSEIPAGGKLYISNLGQATVKAGRWDLTSEAIWNQIIGAVHELNPEMRNLVDLQGDECEVRDGVRRGKLPWIIDKPFRMGRDGAFILGTDLPVFVPAQDSFQLTHLFIFKDGYCRIGAEGNWLQLDEVEQLFHSGGLPTKVPDGVWVRIEGVGAFVPEKGRWFVEPEERVKEIQNALRGLQGVPTAHEICILAFRDYKQEPNDTNREALREAYEAVPLHRRRYLGDMDNKDWPIKQALGIAHLTQGKNIWSRAFWKFDSILWKTMSRFVK